MARQHDKQFKLDAIQYYEDHKDLFIRLCKTDSGASGTFCFHLNAFF